MISLNKENKEDAIFVFSCFEGVDIETRVKTFQQKLTQLEYTAPTIHNIFWKVVKRANKKSFKSFFLVHLYFGLGVLTPFFQENTNYLKEKARKKVETLTKAGKKSQENKSLSQIIEDKINLTISTVLHNINVQLEQIKKENGEDEFSKNCEMYLAKEVKALKIEIDDLKTSITFHKEDCNFYKNLLDKK